MKVIHKSGKRKKAIARATLKEGKGRVRVNKIDLDFVEPMLARMKIKEALVVAGDAANKVDINVNILGGGSNGQAEAARVAICRAFVEFDKKLHKVFIDYDRQLLVPDVRRREARKPNTSGKARSKRQKSYR